MKQFELNAEKPVNSTEYYIKDGRIEFVLDDNRVLHVTQFEHIEGDKHGFKLPEGLENSRVHECTLTTLQFTREQVLQLKEWINENIR